MLNFMGDPWLDSPFQVFRTRSTWVSFLIGKYLPTWDDDMQTCTYVVMSMALSRADYLGLNLQDSCNIFFLITYWLWFFLIAACRIWSAALWFSSRISREYQLWDVKLQLFPWTLVIFSLLCDRFLSEFLHACLVSSNLYVSVYDASNVNHAGTCLLKV